MANWYTIVSGDLGKIPDFIEHFENELELARKECSVHGLVERSIKELPASTEIRFNQLQEVEAVLNHLNIQLRKIRRKHFVKYLENYQRALTSRDAEKYVDGEDEVVDFETIINEVALIRNKFMGLIKAIDAKQFQINNIVKLRAAGLEDVSL